MAPWVLYGTRPYVICIYESEDIFHLNFDLHHQCADLDAQSCLPFFFSAFWSQIAQ